MPTSESNNLSLYWISGSPPAWRVMLTLLLKGVNYQSCLLNHSRGENKTPEYLSINPKGEVPTLVHGNLVVRESIAIMAYVDRAFEGPALFGQSPQQAAHIWQQVMDFESNFRPLVSTIVQILFRNQVQTRRDELSQAQNSLVAELKEMDSVLSKHEWISKSHPTASDCWLYPSIAWVERVASVTQEEVPPFLRKPLEHFPNLAAWRERFEHIDRFETTIPPHWLNG